MEDNISPIARAIRRLVGETERGEESSTRNRDSIVRNKDIRVFQGYTRVSRCV